MVMRLRWRCGGLLASAALSLSCAALPSIALSPGGPRDPQLLARCLSHFPEKPFSVFYQVELQLGGEVIKCHGMSLVEPPAGELKTLWMTERREPLLYGTIRGADVTIAQAAAPFDDPALAAEVLSSLSLALLSPREEVLLAGRAEDGSPRCRFAGAERIVDVTSRQHAGEPLGFTLREHDAPSLELRREVLSDRGDPALGVAAGALEPVAPVADNLLQLLPVPVAPQTADFTEHRLCEVGHRGVLPAGLEAGHPAVERTRRS